MRCSGGASVATLMGHPATTPKSAPTHARTQRQEVADMGHVQYVLLYEWIVKTHLVNSSQRVTKKKKSIPQSPCPHLNPGRDRAGGGGAGTALHVNHKHVHKCVTIHHVCKNLCLARAQRCTQGCNQSPPTLEYSIAMKGLKPEQIAAANGGCVMSAASMCSHHLGCGVCSEISDF